ncbi:MAG: hypothetical protein EXS15_04290 [Phycisphaerales bacterium]|nr:hypothetical protein [Phycisphaerales bacterium]
MDGDLSVDYLGDGYYALFRDNGDRRIIECVAPCVTDIFRSVARRFGHDHPVEMSYAAHLVFKIEAGIDISTDGGELAEGNGADVDGEDLGEDLGGGWGTIDSKEF